MAPLLTAQQLTKNAGGKLLFQDLRFRIHEGERIVLIGANGCGKSTLLRILAGQEEADEGEVIGRRDGRTALVPQIDHFPPGITVEQAIGPAIDGRVAETLGQCGFTDRQQLVETLSGGWKKRLSIARALVTEPQLLFLDEPTNHLDIDGIRWLEDVLLSASFAGLIVSHDRYFIERTATRVVELNRRYDYCTYSVDGGYSDFLESRSNFLSGQNQYYASLANKVRREIAWLRQGAKARTTKAKGRIKAAHDLSAELRAAPSEASKSDFAFTGTGRKSKEVLKAVHLGVSIEGKRLFNDLSFTLAPGVRLGIIGPNGSGKTTLQRILYGEKIQHEGKLWLSPSAKCLVFDQNRERLDRTITLKEALSPDSDSVVFQGREVHVTTWAKRFLFEPSQLATTVGALSGGEQSRVLIAQLMLQPADILFLDEPTNDLDIPALEVLEDSLDDFPGAIVITTHDRYLLDRLATMAAGLHGNGKSGVYADYHQWEKEHERLSRMRERPKAQPGPVKRQKPVTKLSYIDQRDWDSIESRIAQAEQELENLEEEMQSPEVASDAQRAHEIWERVEVQKAAVEMLYCRWDELAKKVEELE